MSHESRGWLNETALSNIDALSVLKNHMYSAVRKAPSMIDLCTPHHIANFKFATRLAVHMLLPAEIESRTLIPALRAILAKKLAEDHNIREDQISKMLGVTQAAVSNYIRGTRGDPSLIAKLLSEEQVAEMIDDLSGNLASDVAYTPSSLSKFIGLCNYIKSSLLICEIHHNLESNIDEQVCKECESMLLKGPGNIY